MLKGNEVYLLEDGCGLHTHCLTCPLPRCRFEDSDGQWYRGRLRDAQALLVQRYFAKHGGNGNILGIVDALAAQLGVIPRTVFRYKARVIDPPMSDAEIALWAPYVQRCE